MEFPLIHEFDGTVPVLVHPAHKSMHHIGNGFCSKKHLDFFAKKTIFAQKPENMNKD